MTDFCKICGVPRIWIDNHKDGRMPVQIEDHKQAAEINAMIEDEKITREQESRQIVEVTVKQRRRRKQ